MLLRDIFLHSRLHFCHATTAEVRKFRAEFESFLFFFSSSSFFFFTSISTHPLQAPLSLPPNTHITHTFLIYTCARTQSFKRKNTESGKDRSKENRTQFRVSHKTSSDSPRSLTPAPSSSPPPTPVASLITNGMPRRWP